MKMRDAWGSAVKLVGVAALFCGILLLAVMVGAGKRGSTGKAGSPTAAASQAAKPGDAKENQRWAEAYGKLPLSFEENQGQAAREVRYVSHGRGYELFLTPQEAVIALRTSTHLDSSPLHRTGHRALGQQRRAARAAQITAIRMSLQGANPEPQISGDERLPTRVNYFTGSDPKNWHTDVPAYARVKYAGIYAGVDLVFYGNQRRLEYDFVVAPGADPKAIQLKIDGARKMRINSRGDLVLSVAGGEVELQKPLVYQQVKDGKREISANYLVTGDHRVTFSVANYDRSKPLILDPILNYSTYLGGSGKEGGFPMGIAVDNAGDAFLAGQTTSVDFPAGTNAGVTINPNPNPNNGASFVAELNPAGTQLLYSTYLVGTSTNPNDGATSVAVDSTGKLVYVTGVTSSAGFPTNHPLPTTGGQNSANITRGTCFVTKLDLTQSGNNALVFSTYLGGTGGANGGEIGNGIAVDANGNAYVVGQTFSTNFPVANAYQDAFNPLNVNNAFGSAFLSKINTINFTLVYSTYLSGNGANAASTAQGAPGYGDQAFGVAVDTTGNAYIVGTTTSNNSTNFPSSSNANQMAPPAANVLSSAFVSKIDTTMTPNPPATTTPSLLYSTYIAGSTQEEGNAIALGPNNVAYVTGLTNSNDFPTTPRAFDTSVAGPSGKAFVSVVDTTKTGVGNSLTYSTYLGGSGGETGFGIRVDGAGNAYVVGTTASTDFPGTNTGTKLGGFQTTRPNSFGSPFIAKLFPGGNRTADLLYSTYFGGSGDAPTNDTDQGYGIAIDSANPPNVYITGQTFSANMPVFPNPTSVPPAFQTALKGPSDTFVAKLTLIPTMAIMPAAGTTLDFGTVLIGTTSAAQTVTLTNNTTGPITFASAAKSGTNAADYTVTTAGCSPNIVVGTPCVVTVTFTPTAPPATEIATLTITDGDSTSPQVLNLTGKGTATPPDFTLSAAPTTLTVAQGAVGTPVTISVNPTNGFNAAVALTCTGAPVNSTCVLNPGSITAPATSTLTFTAHAMLMPLPVSRPVPPLNILRIVPLFVALMLLFLMQSTQRLRTRLAMASAVIVCVTLAACSGGGSTPPPQIPGIGLAPTSLSFGNQALNTASSAQTVTLTSTGTAALGINSIAASGDFAETNNCPASLPVTAGSNTCAINVTFTPTALAARNGTLTITDNASASPHTVSLTGTGVPVPTAKGNYMLTITGTSGTLVHTTTVAVTVN
jgi:hypothetical protein